MKQIATRKLTLMDLLILVAASAPGLAVFQLVGSSFDSQYLAQLNKLFVVPERGWSALEIVFRPGALVALAIPLLGPWTLALFVFRFRKPRPSLRRALRQPGVLACLAALVAVFWGAVGLAVAMTAVKRFGPYYSRPTPPPPQVWMRIFWVDEVFPLVGLAVVTAWLTLAASGRFHRTTDWVDGFGRFLGVSWIVIGLVWVARAYQILL
jgi:hypothetical protein